MTSLEQWRRESARSIERSQERRRRREERPHPFPVSGREWLVALGIAGGIVLVGYAFLVFFGAAAWS